MPGFPDNTVINYVFCPHVFVPKFRFLFPSPSPFPDYIFCPPLCCFLLLSCYCNPGLIKSPDIAGRCLVGERIMLSVHLLTQLLTVVVFSLITSCQYANKLPRLFSILGLHCKIYDRNDDFQTLLHAPPPLTRASLYDEENVWCVQFDSYFLPQAVLSGNVFTALCVRNFQPHLSMLARASGKGGF